MAKPVSESIGNILGLNSKEKSEEKKRTKKHAEKKHADFTDSDAKSVGGKKRNERRNDQRDYQSNEKDNVNSDTLQGQPVLEEQRTAKTDEKTEQLGQELKTKRMDDVKPGPSNPGKGPSRSNNPGAGSGASGSSKQGSHDQATDPEVQAEQQPVAEPGDDILDSGNQTKPNSGADFKNLLQQIHRAAEQGFENLKSVCALIELSSLDLDERKDFCSMEVDETSKSLLPASRATKYVPIKTTADGNCLFRAASIFAFGHENRHEEMRVRTVVELAVNSKFYLEDEDIKRRLQAEIPALNLNYDSIKTEFETEVLKITRDSAWASYWHLQALGTVLKRLVQSVYPDHGRSDIKKYYNTVITPRLSDQDKEPLTIMWTHTAGDDATTFTPNHFVPLISAEKMAPFWIEVLQEQRIARTDEKVEQLGQELKTLRMEDVKPVPESKNNGHVPSENDHKSIEPLKSGGISRGPYHQETAENYKVNSGGSRKRVKPGCLVTDTIRHDVDVMDELALQLDYPARDVPNSQYWLHLSQRLEVPVDKRMLIQQDSDYRPSENMFAYLFAREPKFTIDRLKGYFSKIHRGDLVSMLDKCSLKGTDAWGKLREQDWETFHRICLELDCSKFDNWDDFGREVDIPDDVLGKCARSGDYAETILLIIYAKNPTLQIEKMKDALKDMVRCDVCDKLSELPENSTIQTLLEDCDVLRKVCDLLDKDEPSANWKVFAQKFGVSREECDYLRPASVHSPTKQLMEYLSQAKPSLTLESFLKAVLQIDRRDVVKVSLKKFFDHNDIDIIVDTIEQREQRETNKL